MQIWVVSEGFPSISFLIPKETADEEQLLGFHLSIPIGYMYYAAFFCMATETVKERTLANLDSQSQAPPHLLETLVDFTQEDNSNSFLTPDDTQDREWSNLSSQARAAALANVEVYLGDFIGIVQG